MTDGAETSARMPSATEADRVLARAAEPDAGGAASVSVARLRRVALVARIAAASFDAALEPVGAPWEIELTASEPTSGHVGVRPPPWVRICSFGAPDGRAAMAFYYFCLAGLFALPVLALTGTLDRSMLIVGTLMLVFSAWSTSRLVQWFDRHGWNTRCDSGSRGSTKPPPPLRPMMLVECVPGIVTVVLVHLVLR